MRKQIIMLAGVLLTGCATQPPAMQTSNIPPEIDRASSALAFDAPITFDQSPLDLSRDDRGPSAFVGYEIQSTSAYDVITDNRNSTNCDDRFIRESITEQSGVIAR